MKGQYSSSHHGSPRRFMKMPRKEPQPKALVLPALPATEQEALFRLVNSLPKIAFSYCGQWRNSAGEMQEYLERRLEATIF